MALESTNQLRNLGPKSQVWLTEIGIETAEGLRAMGAVQAYILVKKKQPKASLLLLYAMHAALQDRDWRAVTSDEKEMLRELVQNQSA